MLMLIIHDVSTETEEKDVCKKSPNNAKIDEFSV